MMQSPYGIDNLRSNINEITESQRQALVKECALFARCFNTESGRKVLEILKKKVDAQTWDPNKGSEWGYYHEGQNDVLRYIINRVNYIKEK